MCCQKCATLAHFSNFFGVLDENLDKTFSIQIILLKSKFFYEKSVHFCSWWRSNNVLLARCCYRNDWTFFEGIENSAIASFEQGFSNYRPGAGLPYSFFHKERGSSFRILYERWGVWVARFSGPNARIWSRKRLF